MKDIQHYRKIDKIRSIEKEVEGANGKKLFDISNWNSGEKYKSGLMKVMELGNVSNFFDYSYSYSMNPEIIKSLTNKHDYVEQCAIFHSATSAIASICAVLKQLDINRICIITPSYFSAYESFCAFDFDVISLFYDYYDGYYHIPFDEIKKNNVDAIWITQPVFSTGMYIDNKEICNISNNCKFLICDACMCPVDRISSLDLDYDKSFVILSPHKTISINGIKFSYVLCNTKNRQLLEDWGDVISGGLPASSVLAISHYLSENFKKCEEYHECYTTKSREVIDSLLDNTNVLEHIGKSTGSYESYAFKNSTYASSIDDIPLMKIFSKSKTSFIPGCVNGFPPTNKICFRLNHTLNISETKEALFRLISICI